MHQMTQVRVCGLAFTGLLHCWVESQTEIVVIVHFLESELFLRTQLLALFLFSRFYSSCFMVVAEMSWRSMQTTPGISSSTLCSCDSHPYHLPGQSHGATAVVVTVFRTAVPWRCSPWRFGRYMALRMGHGVDDAVIVLVLSSIST